MTENLSEAKDGKSQNVNFDLSVSQSMDVRSAVSNIQSQNSDVNWSRFYCLSEVASQAVSLISYISYTYFLHCLLIYMLRLYHVIVIFCF